MPEKSFDLIALQKKFIFSPSAWEDVVVKIAAKLRVYDQYHGIEIALVGKDRMRQLQKEYFGKPTVSDVLCFPLEDTLEIIVCLDQCYRQAKEYHQAFSEEVLRILIHALLHGVGYADLLEEERHTMWQRQEALVQWARIKIPLWKKLVQ